MLISARNIFPIDNVENQVNVLGAIVFVLQIVRVLPYIDTKYRNQT